MKFSGRMNRDKYIITVYGDLDLYTATKFKESINQYLSKFKKVIISLKGVNYIDSSGIGVMLFIYSKTSSTLNRIVFCDLNDTVTDSIRLTQLDKFLPIALNEQDSIAILEDK